MYIILIEPNYKIYLFSTEQHDIIIIIFTHCIFSAVNICGLTRILQQLVYLMECLVLVKKG